MCSADPRVPPPSPPRCLRVQPAPYMTGVPIENLSNRAPLSDEAWAATGQKEAEDLGKGLQAKGRFLHQEEVRSGWPLVQGPGVRGPCGRRQARTRAEV